MDWCAQKYDHGVVYNNSSSSLFLNSSLRTNGFSPSGPAVFFFLKLWTTSSSLLMSKPSMSVLFIVAVLIFTSFCVTGRSGVIDGNWDFIRNFRVSMPGSLAIR